MTLLVCWVVFPAVLAMASLGCGLLLERAGSIRLPGELLLPAGFATVVVVSLFATLTEATARFTLPAVLALAAVGVAAALPPSRRRVDRWAVAAAVAVFAVFAAPVVAAGEATFAGYIKLDDTATFLALIDRALEHGRSVEGLPPSSYEATLSVNLAFYPLGSLLPLGIGATLVGQDPAWVFQPYLAFLALLLALVLYRLTGLVLESGPARAVAAFLAAQPALLYGYAFWGGIKEVAAAALVALTAALAGEAFARRRGKLALLPLLVAAAALIGVLSIGAAPWVLPVLAAVGVSLRRRRVRLRPVVVVVAGTALLLPSLAVAGLILGEGVLGSVRDDAELGNLVAPLSPLQLLGVWPTGDFRFEPDRMGVTLALIAVVAVAAALGITSAVARRAWELPLYVAAVACAAAIYSALGSPWIQAKALAIGAPALGLAAATGALALFGARRVEGAVLIGLIALGVGWSNALAYSEVSLAPREQLAELEAIGERFAGTGPTLMTEYQPYGVRHFLRAIDAEGASELRRRAVQLRDGTQLEKGAYVDLDAFDLRAILAYRTLVLRRSPTASRPPAQYRIVWSRRFYEVWQRGEVANTSVRHHPLGDGVATPVARASCQTVRRLARAARRGTLAAGEGATPLLFTLDGLNGGGRDAQLETEISVPRGGRWELWVGGSIRGALTVLVDGTPVASERHQLNNAGQYTPLGTAALDAGTHRLRVEYRSGGLAPGSSGEALPIGPLALSPRTPRRVRYVDRDTVAQLCKSGLDWIEALPRF